MPQAQTKPTGQLPMWMQAIADSLRETASNRPAFQAALETAPLPGMIEFPTQARQLSPAMQAIIRHVMDVAGEYGQAGGGSQASRMTSKALKSMPPFTQSTEWAGVPQHASDPHMPSLIGDELSDLFKQSPGFAREFQPFVDRLRERMTPAVGQEAEKEASALLKLLFNPVMLHRYYRGPFPK